MVRDPDQNSIRAMFDYVPETGDLVWKFRPDMDKRWNNKMVGKIAGSTCSGYRKVMIGNKPFSAHRVVWIMFNGEIPEGFVIDHANRDRIDNRLENLRLATLAQNCQNSNKKPNKTGFTGVVWNSRAKAWRAMIRHDGKHIFLGYFNSPEEAGEAYKRAAKELFGEFYCPPEIQTVEIEKTQQAVRTQNKSGYRGVCWAERSKAWRAAITVNGKRIYIGFFQTPQEASAAYEAALLKYRGPNNRTAQAA